MDGANEKSASGATIFTAQITPHRSLSNDGFLILMLTVAATAIGLGSLFFMMGAWPVIGFFGLAVALVWLAFRANYRAARARETVEVSPAEILVRRISAGGAAAEWRFNPYWARLMIQRDEDDAVRRLALASHGRELEIGHWLSPPEKADFAAALSNALGLARRGPAPA